MTTEAQKEKDRIYAARYRANHPGCNTEWTRQDRKKDPEKYRAKDAKRYLENADRLKAQMAVYYKTNADKIKNKQLEYRLANPGVFLSRNARRRAASNGSSAEKFTHREIFERDGWICQLCGEPIDPTLSQRHPMMAALDHIIPVSKGGDHTRANVQATHFGCNARKRDKVDGEHG